MSRTVKKLKAVLSKLESLAERFETAGFDQQAGELDSAADLIESLIDGLKEL